MDGGRRGMVRKTLEPDEPNFWLPVLEPIKQLKQDQMFDAWSQCALYHYTLWQAGIYHLDISCDDLMYYMFENGQVIGVLIDFDLGSSEGSTNPFSNERTGTSIPFMAIDFFDTDGEDREVKHLYRHGMESFIWVLVWISVQYRDGKKDFHDPAWTQVRYSSSGGVARAKSRLLDTLKWVEHIESRVLTIADFLANRQNVRHRFREELDVALVTLRKRLADPTSEKCQIKESEEEIERLKAKLIEESDDNVFMEFALHIGLDKQTIKDTVATAMRGSF